MKILGVKFDPSQSEFAEFEAPVGAEVVSVVIPKSMSNLIGVNPIDLNPMALVSIGDNDEESEMIELYIQVVTTGSSKEGSKYLDSIFWNGNLWNLFWGIK